jgi:hypothetical protein
MKVKKFGIVQASKVGPTVAEDIKPMHIGRFLELLIVFLYLLLVLENGSMV